MARRGQKIDKQPRELGNDRDQLTKVARIGMIAIIVALIIAFFIVYASGSTSRSAYKALQSNYASLQSNYAALKSNFTILQYNLSQPTLSPTYEALESKYSSLQSNYSSLEYNLSHPYIKQLYNNSVVVPHYAASYRFYNATYGLYNNYTTAGTYNVSFNVPNDGYFIIEINNVTSSLHGNIQSPLVGTYGVQIYSDDLSTYYTRIIKPFVCTFSIYGGTYNCPTSRPTITGWGLYPLNYSATYLAPVSRGIVNISLTNYNSYPINMAFSVTYIGIKYTNMTPITANYS